MQFTERELQDRYLRMENAIASQRLEGLEPDAQTIADLECIVQGEFDIEEALKRLRDRSALGQI